MIKTISNEPTAASRLRLSHIAQQHAQVFKWVRRAEASIISIEKPGVYAGSDGS